MITIQHKGGTGVNNVYSVYQDGEWVARIDHPDYNRKWSLTTWYGYRLAGASTVDALKTKAATMTYPTKQEVYDLIVPDVEKARRHVLEKERAHVMALLVREMIEGMSNSARDGLASMMQQIETTAKDRTDTKGLDMRTGYVSGQRHHYGTAYPEAPTVERANKVY